jgi:hypothetical protein
VQLGAVALVLAEAILRETRAEVAHNRVARDLCDHARCRDTETVAIAVDDRRLRQGKGKNRQAVDEDVLGLQCERGKCGAHRFVSGAQNVDRIDFHRIDHTNRPQNGAVGHEIVINLLPFFRQELLGIVQFTVAKFFRKNNGRRHNRPSESAAASLVDAGDRRDTYGAKFAFMAETTATVHLAN